jgi:hypothetical protein
MDEPFMEPPTLKELVEKRCHYPEFLTEQEITEALTEAKIDAADEKERARYRRLNLERWRTIWPHDDT